MKKILSLWKNSVTLTQILKNKTNFIVCACIASTGLGSGNHYTKLTLAFIQAKVNFAAI